MSVIDTLRAEGAQVLDMDLRSLTCLDWSGNGNHGTPTDVVWGRDGAMFTAATSVITVADSDELQLTEGTLVTFSPFTGVYSSRSEIVSKRDAGGVMWDLFTNSATEISLYDGAGSPDFTPINYDGKQCISVNFKSGERADLYLDGVHAKQANANSAIAADDSDVKIGGPCPGQPGGPTEFQIAAVLIFNRKLTATEHAQVYAELAARRWPTQHTRRWSDWLGTGAAEGWGTGWGTPVTEDRTAGQFVGPFEIISGTHKVTTDTIDGKLTKVVECVADGVIAIPVSAMGQTSAEAAYGTWDLWVNKADADQIGLGIVAQSAAAPSAGDYELRLLTTEEARLIRTGATTPIDGISFTADAWHHWKVTRTSAGIWTIYLDGVSVGTGTDATITSGSYFTIDMDAGDKIALSDLGGGHGHKKYIGVVSP